MTYLDLIRDADRQLDDGRITLGEYEEMIEPLNRGIDHIADVSKKVERASETAQNVQDEDLISKLSEIRSEYNCFDEDGEPYYRALSEAIKILSQRADGDTISRQAAIDAITAIDEGVNMDIYTNEVREILSELPSVQQTLFGYKIDHLAYIARVMEKEGVTAEYAVRTFDDMSRVVRMILEEAQQKAEEMLHERFNQQTGGD